MSILKDGRSLFDKVVHEIYLETGLSKNMIHQVVKSEFEFVKRIMEEREYKSIRLQYFGIFGVKPGRLDHPKNKFEKTLKR